MKQINYITSLLFGLLLLVGVADVVAQVPGKMQQQTVAIISKGLEFTAYVSGQDVHLDFETAINTDLTIELYNLTGAKVAEWKVQKNTDKYCEVSLNEPLRKGLYIIKVSAGQHVVAKKVQV